MSDPSDPAIADGSALRRDDDTTARNARRQRPAETTDGLAAPIRALATASLPPRDRSLPATLCTTAGEVGLETADPHTRPDSDRLGRLLEPAATSVVLLEGYVRLRLALVAGADGADHDARIRTADATPEWLSALLETVQLPADRDAVLLASDHLHAGAYATIADAPLPAERQLELYRLLTEGSSALARRFLLLTDAAPVDERRGAIDYADVEATLAETAGALGAAVVGAPTETRTALRTYSHAVMTALTSRTPVASAVDLRSRAARILAGEVETPARAAPRDGAKSGSPTVESHLERAREALESLAAAVETTGSDSTPLDRLERATRLPFSG
ncbi:hypothetical protein Htur_3405 [Haloterrigena turkmenica DSM 5511]|uniref:Polyprenyl synthetase n=1 Tax=Haloterrigena turkmenica (strain ATCC 51198 / DSM 5511 / JCM 9101 / NCIMB 13204 / VKM B-1734 / 4k) TaxID=543526 RepID=D2RQ91_HALTV|nr:hypothetical protein [Haloterrigena turkmenica]ADB62268.1 hypothetical protein Htur_3405 [Haloterrigena turkmenica DSM 5511]